MKNGINSVACDRDQCWINQGTRTMQHQLHDHLRRGKSDRPQPTSRSLHCCNIHLKWLSFTYCLLYTIRFLKSFISLRLNWLAACLNWRVNWRPGSHLIGSNRVKVHQRPFKCPNLCYIYDSFNELVKVNDINRFFKFKIHFYFQVCWSTEISAWLVRVWGSGDTTLLRTFFRAVSGQFQSNFFFLSMLRESIKYKN